MAEKINLSPRQIFWGRFYTLLHAEAEKLRKLLADLAAQASKPEQGGGEK